MNDAGQGRLGPVAEVPRMEAEPLGIEVGVVRLGNGTGFLPFLVGMPGALRDRLFARQFGLDALREAREGG